MGDLNMQCHNVMIFFIDLNLGLSIAHFSKIQFDLYSTYLK